MDFRSHLVRPIDVRSPSNLTIAILTLITGGVAVVRWLGSEPAGIVFAPIYVFLIWALIREIDPDHNWSALVGAALTAAWALTGSTLAPALAIVGLMVAARIVTSTTGRRPLPLDLVAVSVLGIAIGFTVEGWAAGFGIALAIYLDDRFGKESRLMAVGAAAVTAIGTTVVASLTSAFPERLPNIDQVMAIAAGLAALLLLIREPAHPITQVDARHAAFIDRARLHSCRTMVGILVFLMTVLTGVDAEGMLIVVLALVLTIVSNEIELLRRPNL